MSKSILWIVALFFCLSSLEAQERIDKRLGIETGFLLTSNDAENLSFFLNLEPKVRVAKNTFLGLRLGLTLNGNRYANNGEFQFEIDNTDDSAILSIVPNLDYYFSEIRWNDKMLRPYLGLGLGYYALSVIEIFNINSFGNKVEVEPNKRVGLLFRGGFELRRFRFGLEYTLMPKADMDLPDGQTIGTVANSYLGLSFGLVIGGGYSR